MHRNIAVTLLTLFAIAFGCFTANASATTRETTTPARERAALLQFAQANLSGTYEGNVERFIIKGHEARATRVYRMVINPDMVNATVWIHEDGKLLYTLLAKLQRRNNNVYAGTTRPVEGKNYTPDKIELQFAADGRSVHWYHNDNTMEGSGTLRRQ
ncbi:MAG: hypothetical protein HY244_03975 [Rhizobiales bacterium]|nr:hypothetical protein [Hyphomicrobiales bacterium]